MKLFELIKKIDCKVVGDADVEIMGLFHNDKDVCSGGLFFCIDGIKNSGSFYAESAVDHGAVAIVCSKCVSGLSVTQIIVSDVRKAMSLIAAEYYGNPAKRLKMIGVTGTNGKTTTSYIVASLINQAGSPCAIIGTNGIIFGEHIIETGMTTPDPIELHSFLAKLVKAGIEYVCMEVSAHATYLSKVEGIYFDAVIWTNLSEDHLDFFETMDKYFEAKKKVFSPEQCKLAIINVDDEYGERLFDSINTPKVTYSICKQADFMATEIRIEKTIQKFCFNNKIIESNFLGKFNASNLMGAIACFLSLGFCDMGLEKYTKKIPSVPGRFNVIEKFERLFVVDYAHTPDGLSNVLRLCHDVANGGRTICVFGCGGNRETQKRSKMGEIATKYADFSIITSDNPRFEKRENIARDIENGVVNSYYKIILDRAEAIKFAFDFSSPGDLILVAGKGAENYIDENGSKTYYNDFDEIEKIGK